MYMVYGVWCVDTTRMYLYIDTVRYIDTYAIYEPHETRRSIIYHMNRVAAGCIFRKCKSK